MKTFTVRLVLFAALAIGCAQASPIVGSVLNIDGAANVGNVFTNFTCSQPGDTLCNSAAGGDFLVVSSTGVFAQYNGTVGQIDKLPDSPGAVSLSNFITFNLNSNVALGLTQILAGTDAASSTCAGLTNCTPTFASLVSASNPLGLSAINLNQSGAGTTLTVDVQGVVFSSGSQAPLNGIFTSQIANDNPQQALAALLGAHLDGLPLTFSAQMTAVAPEPVTFGLAGAGLLTLGLIRRRRK
jgi:hypothetical protein